MAERIEVFTVSVPANTAKATPQVTSLVFAPGNVTQVEILIPGGHAGLTGFQLQQAKQTIIPNDPSQFLTADDEVIRWPLDGFLNNGDWQLRAFNTDDTFAHQFFLRFLIDELREPTTALAPPLPLTAGTAPPVGFAPPSAAEGGAETPFPGEALPAPETGAQEALPPPAQELPAPEEAPAELPPEVLAGETPPPESIPFQSPAPAAVLPVARAPVPTVRGATTVQPKVEAHVFYSAQRRLRYIVTREQSAKTRLWCDYRRYESKLNAGDWGKGGVFIIDGTCRKTK